MCGYSDKADALLEDGISPQATMCQICPLSGKCGYQSQWGRIVEGHGINLLPQTYLSLDANEKISGPDRMLVIDESPVKQFFPDLLEFDWKLFDDRGRVADMAEDWTADGFIIRQLRSLANALYKAGEGGKPRPSAKAEARFDLLWRVVGDLADVLEGHMPMADLDDGKLRTAADLLSEDVDTEAMEWAQHDEQPSALRERRDMRLLIEHVLACMKRGHDVRNTIELLKDSIRVYTFTPPKVSKHAPVLVLDATAELAPLAHVFDRASPEIDVVDICVKENVRITQVIDTTGSKAALVDRGAARRKRLWKAAESFADGKETLVVVYKEGRPNIDEVANGLHVGTFGNLRGINAWEHCGKAVIAGRLLPPPEALERQRAALFVHRGDPDGMDHPPQTIDSYLKEWGLSEDELRYDGYLDDDGNPMHPDAVTEDMRREICEGEIIQAVGRLRSVNSEEPKEVLLIPDIRVDTLPEPVAVTTFAKLLQRGMGNPIKAYADDLVKSQIGDKAIVVPVSAADMHRLAPDRFKTVKSAKRALERHKGAGSGIEIRVSNEAYTANEQARYRPDTGRSGPWNRLIYRAKRGVNDVAGAIAETLARKLGGCFSVKFDR